MRWPGGEVPSSIAFILEWMKKYGPLIERAFSNGRIRQDGGGTGVVGPPQTHEHDSATKGGDLWTKGADLASAATLAVGVAGHYYHVTGTTTITAIASRPAGCELILEFDGALTIAHGAALVLANATNIVTVAGDVIRFTSEGAGVWRQSSSKQTSVASASSVIVQKDDVTVEAAATTLDFTEPDATLVTSSPAGEANINMALYLLLAGRAGGEQVIVGQVTANGILRSNDLVWASAGLAGPRAMARYENFNDALGVSGVAFAIKLSGSEFNGFSWDKEQAWNSGSVAADKDVRLSARLLKDGSSVVVFTVSASGQFAIGADAAAQASASIDLVHTDKALLINRLTTAQRDLLTPANGMVIYNTTLGKFQVYENGAWASLATIATSYSRHTYVNVPDAAKGAVVTAGDAQGAILHSGPNAETADALEVDAETAPGASGLPVTWQYGDTNDLDTAVTWTTIATLTLSSEKSARTTTMTNATIPANRLIRVNYGTIVGSPADVTTTLHVKRPLVV